MAGPQHGPRIRRKRSQEHGWDLHVGVQAHEARCDVHCGDAIGVPLECRDSADTAAVTARPLVTMKNQSRSWRQGHRQPGLPSTPFCPSWPWTHCSSTSERPFSQGEDQVQGLILEKLDGQKSADELWQIPNFLRCIYLTQTHPHPSPQHLGPCPRAACAPGREHAKGHSPEPEGSTH